MLLASKERYAIAAIIDLAQSNDSCPTTVADISSRQNISLSYLEQILCKLKNAGIVTSVKGPGGGYILNFAPNDLVVLQIIEAVAAPIKFTNCSSSSGCKQKPANSHCTTHKFWKGLERNVKDYLGTVTIDDICTNNIKINNNSN